MSGRYQHRFGFEHNSGPERFVDEHFGLPRSQLTLAEQLKDLGYATGMVGKWHIGFTKACVLGSKALILTLGSWVGHIRTFLEGVMQTLLFEMANRSMKRSILRTRSDAKPRSLLIEVKTSLSLST